MGYHRGRSEPLPLSLRDRSAVAESHKPRKGLAQPPPEALPSLPDDVEPYAKFMRDCSRDVVTIARWVHDERSQFACTDAPASLGAAMKLSFVLQCEAAAATGDPDVEYVTPFERGDEEAWKGAAPQDNRKVKTEVGSWILGGRFNLREDSHRNGGPGAVPSAGVLWTWAAVPHCLVAEFLPTYHK